VNSSGKELILIGIADNQWRFYVGARGAQAPQILPSDNVVIYILCLLVMSRIHWKFS